MTEKPGLRVRQGKQGAGIRTANRIREVAVPSPPVTHGGTTDSSEPCDPGKAERDRFVLLLHGLSSQGWCGWMGRATTHPMCDTTGKQSLRVDSVNVLSARTNEAGQRLQGRSSPRARVRASIPSGRAREPYPATTPHRQAPGFRIRSRARHRAGGGHHQARVRVRDDLHVRRESVVT